MQALGIEAVRVACPLAWRFYSVSVSRLKHSLQEWLLPSAFDSSLLIVLSSVKV